MYLKIDIGIFAFYLSLSFATLLSGGAIAGISLAVLGVLFFAACLYLVFDRKRKAHKISPKDQFNRAASGSSLSLRLYIFLGFGHTYLI